jgi:trimethylamine--corrinoid protein Co-methyltransferase
MRPRLQLLSPELVQQILEEAFELIQTPGVRVGATDVGELLRAAGAEVSDGVAHIPKRLARACLSSVPRDFHLYNRQGDAVVHYGGESVQFDPGSSCVQVLDAETMEARSSIESDLVRIVQITEMLPQFAAQSTAVVCNDVPSEIGDIYRLYVVLSNSNKPIVTGAFSSDGLSAMLEMLASDAGGYEQLRQKPRAIFDVCPSPPLNWSEFGSHNLIELARAGVPAEIVSMPLAGGASPVTLAGSITQHAAECIAGITIHQLAAVGAPIVWGGAPAIFDMQTGSTPMGAIETAMLNMGCAEVGKSLGLPTHGYLVATDSKLVDSQAGAESARSAVLGALSGINMISGAGMIDSLACFSLEKLVIDAESIASAQRLLRGVERRGDTLALGMFAQIGLSGEFLKLKETRQLFREEQHLPSEVIDRASRGEGKSSDAFERARAHIDLILKRYQKPELREELLAKWEQIIEREKIRRGVLQSSASHV